MRSKIERTFWKDLSLVASFEIDDDDVYISINVAETDLTASERLRIAAELELETHGKVTHIEAVRWVNSTYAKACIKGGWAYRRYGEDD